MLLLIVDFLYGSCYVGSRTKHETIPPLYVHMCYMNTICCRNTRYHRLLLGKYYKFIQTQFVHGHLARYIYSGSNDDHITLLAANLSMLLEQMRIHPSIVSGYFRSVQCLCWLSVPNLMFVSFNSPSAWLMIYGRFHGGKQLTLNAFN